MTSEHRRQIVTLDLVHGLVYPSAQLYPSVTAAAPEQAVPFLEWCATPYAELRWRQLVASQPGEEVIVEQGGALEGARLLHMVALNAGTSETKQFSVSPVTSGEYHQLSLETVSQHVLALVTDLIFILDAEGHIAYASDSVHRFLGYEVNSLLGQPVTHFLLPEDAAQFQQRLGEHAAPGQRLYRARHQNGSQRLLELFWSNLLDNPVVAGILLVGRDVTKEDEIRRAFAEQQLFYQAILEDLPYQVAVLDHEARYVYVNPAAVGNPEVRAGIIGLTDEEYCRWRGHAPALATVRRQHFDLAVTGRHRVNWEESMVDPQGHRRYHQRHYLPVFGPEGRLARVIGYGRDDTERQRHIAMNVRQTQILQRSTQGAPSQEILADLRTALQEYYPDARVTVLLGQVYADFLNNPGEPAETVTMQTATIMSGTVGVGALRLQCPGANDSSQRILEHLARLAGLVVERAQHVEQLEQLAYVDTLTGLPNRAALVRTLGQALDGGQRRAVIIADLKGFRGVNNRHGYATGDALLKQVARQIETCLRGNILVARVGGNAFALTLPSSEIEPTLGVLTRSFAQPMVIGLNAVQVRLHFGVSLEARQGDVAGEIVQQAEHAVHRSRQLGQAVAQYNAEEYAVELTAMTLEGELREAFADRRLFLMFQPLVKARSGHYSSAEVLLRWFHPERGPVSPEVFIALAEQSDLILDIGRWVLREACLQAAAWPGGPSRINVNVSARQFEDPGFVNDVVDALDMSGLPADCLELELTESVLMTSGRAVVEVLERLDVLGVRLALDDFGTGYSSLAYLNRFPLDVLKIDRSFVHGLGREHPDLKELAIVRSTIALAHELGLEVVAEGVEDEHQRDVLVDLGCDLFQGYLYSPPLSLEEAISWSVRRGVLP
ncbi:EAL domain-containing protein (plasmid) [Deinococcus radiomollis]|uniref:sensor domain-containing protein n=1 Tax=Deinococcus radiomollis TaxID=468916 RepID=UPI0038929A5C